MNYTRHIVADMDITMVQHCLICGHVVSDYRNCAWPLGTPPPKGFAAGEVFISDTKNPTIFTVEYPTGETVNDCIP